MQKKNGRYLGEVRAIYRKNGSSKGARHASITTVQAQDVGSLSNLSLRVFVPVSPHSVLTNIPINMIQANTAEDDNLFWNFSLSTGHLWTHAPIKHLVYHLGPAQISPLKPGSRYVVLDDAAYSR